MTIHPLHKTREGWRLHIHVQPRARQTECVGIHGDSVKIRLAAPPVDGKANEELIRFLADTLRLPKSDLALVSGASGRKKTIALPALKASAICSALHLPEPDLPPTES